MCKMQLVSVAVCTFAFSICGCRNAADRDLWAKGQATEIAAQVDLFRVSYGRLPKNLDEVIDYSPDTNIVDPWGNAFVYQRTERGYEVRSMGATSAKSDDVVVARTEGEA
jgi:hypothetical protein